MVDDDALAADLVGGADSLAARVFGAGFGAHFRTSISGVVVPAADHAATVAAAGGGRSAEAFPPGFFAREDERSDAVFYGPPRLVTHIDDGAVAAVSDLYANPMATERVVQDLNAEPALPFAAATFDAVLCCVAVDYLVRPVEVLRGGRPGPATWRPLSC